MHEIIDLGRNRLPHCNDSGIIFLRGGWFRPVLGRIQEPTDLVAKSDEKVVKSCNHQQNAVRLVAKIVSTRASLSIICLAILLSSGLLLVFRQSSLR
jgi:hypothetical protein